ncbi:TPA: ribonuclease III [Candidatus Edwardsbacteria bacterium]|nr:ribonuclease III [Candidatus Edwardsbacteria bacterium]HBZ86699.1 ribonuclease III [Candidatus Edwardsbacteria bacterium]
MFKKIFPHLKRKLLPGHRKEALNRIEARLGWKIRDQELFLQSLRHRSASSTHLESNERMELLGDAVLGLLVCEYLYHTRPRDDEGKLTEIKSLVVSKRILSQVARELGVGEMLELSREELASGGRSKDSILCDAFESLIAAYYLDSGLGAVRKFLEKGYFWRIEHLISSDSYRNYKGLLQEYLQSHNITQAVRYNLKAESGPKHNRMFEVELKIGRKRYGIAWGASKKEAEQSAAQQTIEKLKTENGGR